MEIKIEVNVLIVEGTGANTRKILEEAAMEGDNPRPILVVSTFETESNTI